MAGTFKKKQWEQESRAVLVTKPYKKSVMQLNFPVLYIPEFDTMNRKTMRAHV